MTPWFNSLFAPELRQTNSSIITYDIILRVLYDKTRIDGNHTNSLDREKMLNILCYFVYPASFYTSKGSSSDPDVLAYPCRPLCILLFSHLGQYVADKMCAGLLDKPVWGESESCISEAFLMPLISSTGATATSTKATSQRCTTMRPYLTIRHLIANVHAVGTGVSIPLMIFLLAMLSHFAYQREVKRVVKRLRDICSMALFLAFVNMSLKYGASLSTEEAIQLVRLIQAFGLCLMPVCWYNLFIACFGDHPLEPRPRLVFCIVAGYSIYMYIYMNFHMMEWKCTGNKEAKRVIIAFCYYIPVLCLVALNTLHAVFVRTRAMLQRSRCCTLGRPRNDESEVSTAQLLAKSAPTDTRLKNDCGGLIRHLSDEIKDSGRVKCYIASSLLLKCIKAKRNAQEFWMMRRFALDLKDDSTNTSTKAVKCDSLPSIYSFDDNSSLLDDEPCKDGPAIDYCEVSAPMQADKPGAHATRGLSNVRPKALGKTIMPKTAHTNKALESSPEIPQSSTTTNGVSTIIPVPPCTPMESTPVDEPKEDGFKSEFPCSALDEKSMQLSSFETDYVPSKPIIPTSLGSKDSFSAEVEPVSKSFQKSVSRHEKRCQSNNQISSEILLEWCANLVFAYSVIMFTQLLSFLLEWIAICYSLQELAIFTSILGVVLYYVPYLIMVTTFSYLVLRYSPTLKKKNRDKVAHV
ncbi:uncharacterized protein [Watersipora subatra]|uniref:uncharacterized protein isoform X2 n=1 Tax=Watersipora subatra TaxID=2589382 RepID=UPI00355C8399